MLHFRCYKGTEYLFLVRVEDLSDWENDCHSVTFLSQKITFSEFRKFLSYEDNISREFTILISLRLWLLLRHFVMLRYFLLWLRHFYWGNDTVYHIISTRVIIGLSSDWIFAGYIKCFNWGPSHFLHLPGIFFNLNMLLRKLKERSLDELRSFWSSSLSFRNNLVLWESLLLPQSSVFSPFLTIWHARLRHWGELLG